MDKGKNFTVRALVENLKDNIPSNASFLDRIKIVYRPYICPFDLLLHKAGKNNSIFDIGCGSGMFLKLVSSFCTPRILGGVEIKNELVSNANELLKNFPGQKSIRIYDGKILPIEINKFSHIFMIDVLHHIPKKDQKIFLKELFHKINPGTIVFIKDIDAANPLVVFNKLHDLVISKEIGNEISLGEMENAAKEIGFKIIETKKIRQIVYPHYLITLSR